jgi:hypothetical protein
MRRLKWWHWVLIVIVVFIAANWILTGGENPIVSFEKGFKGFADGWSAASK